MSSGDPTEGPIRIRYTFRLSPGDPGKHAEAKEIRHEVVLDRKTLERVPNPDEAAPPAWTALDSNKCPHCPLNSDTHPVCPAAKAIAAVVEPFRDCSSHTLAHVEVTTAERTYVHDTPLQHALQGLFGLVLATSGCPQLAFLRPMARFHLPFATIDETIVRATSMHLLEQYIRVREGNAQTIDLSGLSKRYEAVSMVNLGVLTRLRTIGGREGNRNALCTLDVFGKMVRMEVADDFPDIGKFFPETRTDAK